MISMLVYAGLCYLVLVWCWFSWCTRMMKVVHQQDLINDAGPSICEPTGH